MTSFLHADLPSEDEDDETYEPEDHTAKSRAKPQPKSRRGHLVSANVGLNAALSSQQRQDKAAKRYEELLQRSQTGPSGQPPAPAPAPIGVANAHREERRVAPARQPTVIYGAQDPDMMWKRMLGIVPPPAQVSPQEAAKRAARFLDSCLDDTVQPPKRQRLYASPPESTAVRPDGACYAPSLADVMHHQPPAVDLRHETPDAAPPQAAAAPSTGVADRTEHRGPDAPVDTAASAAESGAGATAAAEKALAAIAGGALRADAAARAGMLTIKEKRNFAGQEVEVCTEVKAGTKQAQNVQERVTAAAATTGLDAVLTSITGPRKANVMDKTEDDWKGFKTANVAVDEELHTHGRSKDTFLEKQAFLMEADRKTYELQKNARQAAESRR